MDAVTPVPAPATSRSTATPPAARSGRPCKARLKGLTAEPLERPDHRPGPPPAQGSRSSCPSHPAGMRWWAGWATPTTPALLGNTVVWKPSPTQELAAHLTMGLLAEAGLPGVINLVTGDDGAVSKVALADPELAGLHFTGSTATFKLLWRTVADHLDGYRGYPRLVGETGGKDVALAHPCADPAALKTALVRGALHTSLPRAFSATPPGRNGWVTASPGRTGRRRRPWSAGRAGFGWPWPKPTGPGPPQGRWSALR